MEAGQTCDQNKNETPGETKSPKSDLNTNWPFLCFMTITGRDKINSTSVLNWFKVTEFGIILYIINDGVLFVLSLL